MANTPSLEEIMNQAVETDASSGMDDVVQAEAQAQPVDRLHNAKAESDRKIANMEAHMANTQSQLDALMQQLQKSAAQAKPSKDLLYDNPEEFINQTISAAEQRADARVNQRMNETARLHQVVNEIQGKYAEFSQPGSEASKRALQIANSLPKEMDQVSRAKMAMLEAAAEMELVPRSKRKATAAGDDYVAAGGVAKAAQPKSRQDAAEREFLRLLGGDKANDKEVQKEFEKAQKRGDWRNPR